MNSRNGTAAMALFNNYEENVANPTLGKIGKATDTCFDFLERRQCGLLRG